MEDIEIQERPTGYVPLRITEDPLERLLEATNGYPNQSMDSSSWAISRFKLFRTGGHTLQSSIKVLGAVYWVSKDIIFEKNGKTLRKEFECLSLEPYRLIGFAKRIKCFYTHSTKEDIVGIPRFLGLSLFGTPQKDIRTLGNPLRSSYDIASFQLRSEQVSCVEKTLESLRVYGGATIVADCGYGKTRTSISLLALLGRKTLILCNRELLMVQWLTNIESLCPQLKISWLLDSKSIFKTRIKVTHGDSPQYYPGVCDASTDVTIGSIETLLENNVPKDLLQLYGTIIVDEAHHLAAATLVHALPMLPARYVIGLSATPDRRDGLEHALYWLSGPVSFVYKRLPSITGVSSTVEVRQIIPQGCANRELFRFDGSIAFTEMITAMSEDLHRNQLIVMLLKTLLHDENRQKIICVSSLVHHCDVLFEMCNEIFVGVPMARMAGLTKDTALARGPARIIFATYSLLEEGYDDPDLDTLVLLTPRSRIQQTVGRVERTKTGKARPLVLDITDSFCVFPNMWYKRESFYKSRGFLIHKNIILKHI